MTLQSFILTAGLFLSFCFQSNKLLIKFPSNYKGGGGLQVGTKVQANSEIIGTVTRIEAKAGIDALFVTIKTSPGVKIPVGSEFIFREKFFWTANLLVNYSTNTIFLTSKDTAVGSFQSVRRNNSN